MLPAHLAEGFLAHAEHSVRLRLAPIDPRDIWCVAQHGIVAAHVQIVVNGLRHRIAEPLPHQVFHLRVLVPDVQIRPRPGSARADVFVQCRLLARRSTELRTVGACPAADLSSVHGAVAVIGLLHRVAAPLAGCPRYVTRLVAVAHRAETPQHAAAVHDQRRVRRERRDVCSRVVLIPRHHPIEYREISVNVQRFGLQCLKRAPLPQLTPPRHDRALVAAWANDRLVVKKDLRIVVSLVDVAVINLPVLALPQDDATRTAVADIARKKLFSAV